MAITELKVDAVRNLTDVSIEPVSGLNLIYGENGSGKTSLLEAISLLAHGRSFRTSNYRQAINQQQKQLSVFGVITEDDSQRRVGVLRPLRGVSSYRIDGSPVYSSASLASVLPLQVMNAKSFDLLEGSPKVRRRMFDWLVFHVKHEFSQLWRDYTKAVKQRNSLLRRDKISHDQIKPWDIELSRLAAHIDEARRACMAPFIAKVQALLPDIRLPDIYKIDIDYQRGWPDDYPSLEAAFAATLERDKSYGYTTCGAHKSELRILVNGSNAGDILSRGQQKSLVAAFLVAQLALFQEECGRSTVVAIDDLPAELDAQHIQMLASWLAQLNTQIFVTGIYADDMQLLKSCLPSLPCKVFHVKHGEVIDQ